MLTIADEAHTFIKKMIAVLREIFAKFYLKFLEQHFGGKSRCHGRRV